MTMTSREKLPLSADHDWTPEEEIQFFYALRNLPKPVGVNKHFYMACINERLSRSLNRDFTTDIIWAHLRTLYDLDALEELEPLPFPNEEREFSLPEAEFSSLISKKCDASEEPPSIIAVATDNTTTKDKTTSLNQSASKDLEKKVSGKLSEVPKRSQKRTRGSMSIEATEPSTTPPPTQIKRRRI